MSRFPTRREVDRRNHACLNAIKLPPREYMASDMPSLDEFGHTLKGERYEMVLAKMMAPSRLILKVFPPCSNIMNSLLITKLCRSERKSC